ncbi:type II toxin-antitoxin system Phd/YefM family antitoxin [Myroides sp. N17-2]|uniref:type II toxin-antitoxin system Phd/YefM family antitoxin n=1 Tax=Myroides sp. N17-2 TaxID=2030799 RepID=UPI000EFAB8AE|nr:type II toxin-antitoxin system Phd/YefM family antitoxin [Myroides sp. N17-2]
MIVDIAKFRKDIKSYFDWVSRSSEALVISNGSDKGVVLMSLKEYNSLMTTNHELSSRKNEQRLDSAIEKMNKRSQ